MIELNLMACNCVKIFNSKVPYQVNILVTRGQAEENRTAVLDRQRTYMEALIDKVKVTTERVKNSFIAQSLI